MPYCPKCDMEFVDGITICSDCGGELVESKAVADAMKQKMQEEAAARMKAQMEQYFNENMEDEDGLDENMDISDDVVIEETVRKKPTRVPVYIKKSQQYEDLKSSAAAFYLVGGLLLVFSILTWTNIIKLPLQGVSGIVSRSVMTILGVVSLVVAYSSSQSAKKVEGQIELEENATQQLVDWFTGSYDGTQLDAQILKEQGELSPEELALKRFELIQDIVVTNHDIADQSYVDLLAEEIYSKIYED